MSKIVFHLAWQRPGPFGSTVNGPYCNRSLGYRTTSDGMNLTCDERRVTCKFCRKRIDRRAKDRKNWAIVRGEQK